MQTRAALRRFGIRLFELVVIYGVPITLIIQAFSGYVPTFYVMLIVFSLLAVLMPIVVYYMPVSCRIVDNRVVMRTPARTIEAVLLGDPKVEKGGLIPPGRTKALFCGGWRLPTTLLSDCGDEFFFSTPDCDGRWLVAEAKLVKKKGEERRILWICGCAGS